MIRKQPGGDGDRVKVTFRLPADGERRVSVVGDFNDWDPLATPLRRRSPKLAAAVELDVGRRYAFRYLDSTGAWFNDDEADDFVPNEHGGHDGVIDLTTQP